MSTQYGNFADGHWLPAGDGRHIELHNPANGELLAEVARGGGAEVDAAVRAARRALPAWAGRPPVERARILMAVSQAVTQQATELARLECLDTGKPLRQAEADVVATARFFEYYAGLADKVLGTSIPLGDGYHDFTTREPLGVTAHIVPWNFPLQLAARGLAPALATGNTAVVKPAELACLSVLELARICHAAGVPAGVLNVVTGYGHEAGAALVAHPDINHIVFTGSVATGSAVMAAAAKNVVPVVLELGGKSPNIVLHDAPLATVAPALLRAAFPNSGQTCSAGTRVLVQRTCHAELTERLVALCAELKVGPGVNNLDIGPLINAAQRSKVLGYVELGRQEGVEVIEGGRLHAEADPARGHYVMPTLLNQARAGMRVHQEEIFGPVLTLVPFDELDEAVTLANGTDYGLVAGIWGNDLKQAHTLARQVRAGQVYVNCYGAGGGIELPFGGFKRSGFGREKGVEALASYTQTKNICFRIDGP